MDKNHKYAKIRLMIEKGSAREIDAWALAREIDATTGRIEIFSQRLAERALSAVDHATVADATERLHEATQALKDTVEQTDILQKYGDEESYYTVFRLFCAGDHPGTVYSLEEIYDHLALTYDMSGVRLGKLARDLSEWTKKINDDAKKAGIQGRFIPFGDGFVFAVLGNTMPTSAETEPKPVEEIEENEAKVEIAEEKEQPAKTEPDTETERELAPAEQAILDWFDEQPETGVKQPIAIKELSKKFHVAIDATKVIIDELIIRGLLYSYKPNPSHAALLLRTPPEHSAETKDGVEKVGDPELSAQFATEIIKLILGNIQHQQQKIPTSELYRRLCDASIIGTDTTSTDFNSMIRYLVRVGVLETDMGSQLTGRRKGSSKGKKVQVLRAGIASQEVKDVLTSAVRQNILEKVIADYLSASDQTDTN